MIIVYRTGYFLFQIIFLSEKLLFYYFITYPSNVNVKYAFFCLIKLPQASAFYDAKVCIEHTFY